MTWKLRRVWSGVCVVLIVGLIGWWSVRQFITVIPPASLTCSSMHMIKRRILRYAGMHKQLPNSLDELPAISGYSDRLTDAWADRISYRVSGDGSIALTSYGKDGQPGGTGADADMAGTFMSQTPDGRWQDELCSWVVDPCSRAGQ